MKKCKICGDDFPEMQKTQKYCGQRCAYKAIANKQKNKYKKQGLVKSKCICCNGKGFVYQNYQNTQKETINKIVDLYKKGMGVREIQRKLDIHNAGTVSYYLRKANEKVAPTLSIK